MGEDWGQTMNPATPAMRNLVLWLLAQEGIAGKPSGIEQMSATFRVCGKLRSSLLALVGAVGYRSLISRSLTLARKGSPPLEKVQVKEDGSLGCTGALDLELGMDEDTKGGVVLVTELLGLLIIFIGQALTLRLVRDLWPDAPFEGINSKTEKEL
jgi:hypothetical protein